MLRIENYCYKHSFSERLALKNINITLNKGEMILVTGKSGSGKSTLLAAISGLIPHYYGGESTGLITVNGVSPQDVALADMGKAVAFMQQNTEVQFLAPTVEEEIFLSLKCRIDDEEICRKLASSQIDKFKLTHIRSSSVMKLSEGQKQKVVLASLTALKPELILLDEPTANLDPLSTRELAAMLMELKKEGISFLVADHRLSWLREVCEKAAVIDGGEIVWQGDFSSLEDVYISFGLRTPAEQDEKELDEYKGKGIDIKNLSFGYTADKLIIENLSCTIPLAKVTALSGESGLGKTTFGRILAGLQSGYGGEISFNGKLASIKDLQKFVKIVLQNSDHQLYMDSVLSELALAMTLNPDSKNSEIFEVLEQFGLKELSHRHPQSLSGGEKQRLTVAIGSSVEPVLLILDEPTSGLDGHNLMLMANHIKRLALSGCAVLVITHDAELIKLCADFRLKIN